VADLTLLRFIYSFRTFFFRWK